MSLPEGQAAYAPDRLQLNRPLIQQAAGLMLALRWVADALAAFLLLRCYPAGGLASAALVVKVLFGTHAVFAAVAYRRHRRGVFTTAFVTGDMLFTTAVMLIGAHYAEGIYSPVLYLLLVEIASFVIIFGPLAGRLAALAAAAGVIVQAVADALGLWPVPGVAEQALPRLLDFATMLCANALLLIGITRTMRWARAKEQDLRVETERAQAAAEFQAALAELALAALTQEGLDASLGLLCDRARTLLGCDTVMVCLNAGDALIVRALAPIVDGPPAGSRPLVPDGSASGVAARERRRVLIDGAPEGHAEVPPALRARGVRRILALPLVGQSGRVLGTLTCADDARTRDLQTWEVRAELVATHATAAVERAGLVDRLQEEAQRVGALLRVSQEIGVGASYRELVVNVCRLTHELLAADRAALLRSDDEADVTGADGLPEADVEEWRNLRSAIADDPDGMPAPYREAKRDGRLIVAPLCHAGRVYGLLTARRTTTRGRFDACQIALLEGIARQAGMALDNLRLLEEERSAAALATTLLEVAREFNLALDLSTLLARLGVRAVDLTGAAAAVIALWRPREHVYRIEGVRGGGPAAEPLLNVDLGSQVYRRDGDRLRLDPAWLERFSAAFALAGGCVTEVSVSLERGGETAGVLTLLWGAGTEPVARQIALARGLVNQAAIAFQNVRLLEDIREASRLKSEFVATMSHELRTPLNVILGYTNLFLEDAFGPLDAEQRGILVRMQRSARELFELVSATLDLNRLEAGKSRVTVEPVVVPDLFAQLEAETVSGLESSNVEVRWQLGSDLPAMETDRAKLRIVLKNLIGNAIKFTERGNVTIAAEPSDGAVVFTVSDTGMGIRREDLPVIFEMFRQVESANTRRHGGVGLGLYIVKRLLAELRGEINVESEFGAGTSFRVRLPVRLAAAKVAAGGGPRG